MSPYKLMWFLIICPKYIQNLLVRIYSRVASGSNSGDGSFDNCREQLPRATICPLFPGQVLFSAAYFSVRPFFFLIKKCPGFCPVTTDDLAGGVPQEVTTPLTSRV